MSECGQHVIIAANPKSGRTSSGTRVVELLDALQSRGLTGEILHSLEAVQQQSLQLRDSGNLRAVVAAGGDGTADALANLLPPDIPILLFPLGTENLLAKHFGLTGDIQQAVATLEHGHPTRMDVGSANGKLFLVMLSCGFDAQVVREMHAVRKGHINRWSYTGPILRALSKYRFPQLQIRFDQDNELSKSAAWLFVFNVPRYAANLKFCPQADPFDGELDVCTFSRGGIAFGLGYFSRLFFRSHQSMRGFEHHRCQSLEVAAPINRAGEELTDIPFQIDGDPGGVLPLKIETLPERLTILRPAES